MFSLKESIFDVSNVSGCNNYKNQVLRCET